MTIVKEINELEQAIRDREATPWPCEADALPYCSADCPDAQEDRNDGYLPLVKVEIVVRIGRDRALDTTPDEMNEQANEYMRGVETLSCAWCGAPMLEVQS